MLFSVNYKRRDAPVNNSALAPPPVPEPHTGSYQSMLYLEQFTPDDKFSFKRLMQKIVSSRAFEFVILVFILASATCLVSVDLFFTYRRICWFLTIILFCQAIFSQKQCTIPNLKSLLNQQHCLHFCRL